VIRLEATPDLTGRERYGLDLLVDLSRLLVVLDPTPDIVRLTITQGPPQSLDEAMRHGLRFDRGPADVRISRAALGHVTDLAGAAAEQGVRAMDRHGRVASGDNPLVRIGGERQPVVHRWGWQLRAAVEAAAERRPVRIVSPWPEGRRWAAALTHDLDVVSGWPAFTLLRLAELARHGEARRWAQALWAALTAVGGDPIARGVAAILAAEQAAGISSTWFVLSGTPTPARWLRGDVTYRLEAVRTGRLLDAIGAAGHEIGLHGSFRTTTAAVDFAKERDRLARRLRAASPPAGVRQHFLRLRPGRTHAAMQEAGFRYDATYGFADRNGFRLGVADVVPAWLGDREARLSAVPLVWMDRALSKYAGVQDPGQWVADALHLAATCRAVEGLWVGLWHPNLVPALGYPGTPGAFAGLVAGLAETSPYFAPLHRIDSWRRARRGVRARRVAPDGRAELVTAEQSDWVIALEDQLGREVASPTRPGVDG